MRNIEKKDSALLSAVKPLFPECWTKEMFDSAFDTGRFFGFIEEKGEKIAFITYSVSIDTADIEDLFVSPELRRQGFAKKLLTKAIDDILLRKIGRVLLEVRKDNVPAISLYKSFGFKEVSVRKNYYPDGDALVFIKEIK